MVRLGSAGGCHPFSSLAGWIWWTIYFHSTSKTVQTKLGGDGIGMESFSPNLCMNIFFIDLVEGISNTFGKVDCPTRLRSSLGWWKTRLSWPETIWKGRIGQEILVVAFVRKLKLWIICSSHARWQESLGVLCRFVLGQPIYPKIHHNTDPGSRDGFLVVRRFTILVLLASVGPYGNVETRLASIIN